jgi:Flp pilus assembly protein TadD
MSDWDRARVAYGRGLSLAPANPRALYNLALIEANAGRLVEAARRMREAVVHDPGSADPRNELGRIYLRLNQPELAVEEFAQAQVIDPSSSEIAQNLQLAREMLRARSSRQRPAAR